jgi:hypothetical protein
VASLVLLLAALMGPWFADTHPATAETCNPPLVWLGDGRCACLVSPMSSFVKDAPSIQGSLWYLSLPPLLPVLSTLLVLLLGERRWLWVGHLAAWGVVALYSLFFFIVGNMFTWGDGLASVAAVAALVGEILIARLKFSRMQVLLPA